ncbi:MAG TPA: hypothetical protein VHZ02_03950 [Acidimicrobiales bacterium]|nr:hypothetical protein [Acidimicrobiales bacterium]
MVQQVGVAPSGVLTSQVCTYESICSPRLRHWSDRLRPMWDPDGTEMGTVLVHRTMWEWLFICESLRQAGMLQEGRRGLGIGGPEPLASLFAGLGCTLVVADSGSQPPGDASSFETGDEPTVRPPGAVDQRFCPAELLHERVQYREIDLGAEPDDLHDFDFTWSSHVVDHLGSLAAGMDFVAAQMHRLKPGGLAVHATELNLSSDTDTVAEGASVLFRRRDVEDLVRRLRADGHRIAYDLSEGNWPADRRVDVAPGTDTHLRTREGGYETTSLVLVIRKGGGKRTWSRATRLRTRHR